MTGLEQVFYAIGALAIGLVVVAGIGYLRRSNKAKGGGGRSQGDKKQL